jgi:hypothetical protein
MEYASNKQSIPKVMKNKMLSRQVDLLKKGDVLFLLFLSLILLFLLREVVTYPSDTRAFPELILIGTLILSGSLLVVYFFVPSLEDIVISPEPEGEVETGKESKGRFLRGWISIGIALGASFLCGFVFLIPASFISYTMLLGRREMLLKIASLSLATAFLVYMVFDYFLGVPMMHGLLWRI